jgi:hypothetical protein
MLNFHANVASERKVKHDFAKSTLRAKKKIFAHLKLYKFKKKAKCAALPNIR